MALSSSSLGLPREQNSSQGDLGLVRAPKKSKVDTGDQETSSLSELEEVRMLEAVVDGRIAVKVDLQVVGRSSEFLDNGSEGGRVSLDEGGVRRGRVRSIGGWAVMHGGGDIVIRSGSHERDNGQILRFGGNERGTACYISTMVLLFVEFLC
ncbi:hypothetical protein GH714_023438 [Hevea brasiliensis]|uniref:Uncharacterized protein n=1 Tax=Hevea brasiliensis TaxID=3981 RepID=A0A6A6LM77_HEVBR|nr:hypothetical protein GH714_023438 [Hevea brasiliensis]